MSEEERKAPIEEMKKDANSADEKLQKALELLSPAVLNAVKEVLVDQKGDTELTAHNGGVLVKTSSGDEIFVKTTEKGDVFYKSDREGQVAISQHKDGRFSYTDAGQEEFLRVDNNGMESSDSNGSVEIIDGKMVARDEDGKKYFETNGKKWRTAGEDADGTYVLEGNRKKIRVTRADEDEGTAQKYEVKVRKDGTMKSLKGEVKSSEGSEASYKIGFEKDGKTVKSVKAESSTRSDMEQEKSEISLKGEKLTVKTVQVNGEGEKQKTELRLNMKRDSEAARDVLNGFLPNEQNVGAVVEGSANAQRTVKEVQEKVAMIAGDVIDNVTGAGTSKVSSELPLVLRVKGMRGR